MRHVSAYGTRACRERDTYDKWAWRECNLADSWICDKSYVNGDVQVTDHSHTTGKYRGSAHRDCILNLKPTHKTPVMYNNLTGYDSHHNARYKQVWCWDKMLYQMVYKII